MKTTTLLRFAKQAQNMANDMADNLELIAARCLAEMLETELYRAIEKRAIDVDAPFKEEEAE